MAMTAFRLIQPTWLACIPLTAGLLAASCGHGAAGPRTPQTTNVTEQENGRQVTVTQGDTLVVILASNASTGYEWRIAKNDPPHLKPVGKPEFIAPPARSVGVGGKQVFRFQAEAPGKSELELHYLRPFEKGQPPVRTYKVTAQIGPAAK